MKGQRTVRVENLFKSSKTIISMISFLHSFMPGVQSFSPILFRKFHGLFETINSSHATVRRNTKFEEKSKRNLFFHKKICNLVEFMKLTTVFSHRWWYDTDSISVAKKKNKSQKILIGNVIIINISLFFHFSRISNAFFCSLRNSLSSNRLIVIHCLIFLFMNS